MSEFNQEQLDLLLNEGIYHVRFTKGRTVGVMKFMNTYAVVSDYKFNISGQTFFHRFCYPKDTYTLTDVFMIAAQWDLGNPPQQGWVKYKGRMGEGEKSDKFINFYQQAEKYFYENMG